MSMSRFHRTANAARALALSLLLFPAACTGDTATATATAPGATTTRNAHPDDPPPMKFDTTTFNIKGKEFTIELAITAEQSERGLMYRDFMPDDHGMLFPFDVPQKLKFWMKNTRIPLDIVFLDKDCRVVQVIHAKPLDETSVGPDSPTQYVIELNVGMADKLGLKTGDKIDIPRKYQKN
jgi:uncharacterized membrane protein (UPF0127 family)